MRPMKLATRILVWTALLAVSSLVLAIDDGWRWQLSAFENEGRGEDLTRICLVKNDQGEWEEARGSEPARCDEAFVAARDTRTIWPDFDFYEKRSSAFFEDTPERSYRTRAPFISERKERVGVTMLALAQAGVLQRLDTELATGVKGKEYAACEAEFLRAKTAEAVARIKEESCQKFPRLAAKTEERLKEEHDRADMRERMAVRAKSQPRCSIIAAKGFIVSMPEHLAILKQSRSPEDLMARNPLHCAPNALTQLYGCQGVGWADGRKARILGWTDQTYQVAMPIDLIGGRRDAVVYVDRASSMCLNKKRPSLDFAENLINLFKHPDD